MPKRRTEEDFINLVYEKVGNEYSVIGPYVNHMTKIKMRHNICGHEYEVTPNKFLDLERRCPCCYGNIKKTIEDVKKEIEELTNGEYEVISSSYKNTNDPIEILHKKCHRKFLMRRTDFIKENGNRCPFCAGNKRKTINEVKSEIENKSKGEFIVKSNEYKNNKEKLLIEHKKCGTVFKNSFNIFMKFMYCPHCGETLGEQKIENFLKINNIEYKYQYALEGFSKNSKFDFAIFNKNNLILLIEFDGDHHFRPIFGEKRLVQQKKNDKKKNDFCLKNKIRLLRISCKNFNKIDDILNYIILSPTTKIEDNKELIFKSEDIVSSLQKCKVKNND